jgi:hypothetical protein
MKLNKIQEAIQSQPSYLTKEQIEKLKNFPTKSQLLKQMRKPKQSAFYIIREFGSK